MLALLSKIIDPDLHKDIVTLGFVKNMQIDRAAGSVKFDLELTTPACPVRDQFVAACQETLKQNLDWVSRVDVKLTAQERRRAPAQQQQGPSGLGRVATVIAVSSCKGGVGKSSVATNFAFMLSRIEGVRVGLLDADVYGPSLAYLVPTTKKAPPDDKLEQQIQAFEHDGVKLMSMGFLRPDESAALRGPMVSGLVQQMLTKTGWGELDYLVIDMPPGTGDIQLTVGQHANVDAAIVVTTPQQLSLVDVEKGIQLNDKLSIPSVAIVENMAYFVCGCGKEHDVFSKAGAGERIAQQFGIENYTRLPLDPLLSAKPSGVFPFVSLPEAQERPIWQELEALTSSVVRSVAKVKFADTAFAIEGVGEPVLMFTETQRKDSSLAWAGQMPARRLRLSCRSATMIDEWTGEQLFKEEDIAQDVTAKVVESAGRYAMRIEWSDGHSSIFPTKRLKELAEQAV